MPGEQHARTRHFNAIGLCQGRTIGKEQLRTVHTSRNNDHHGTKSTVPSCNANAAIAANRKALIMADYPALPLFTDAYLADCHPALTLEQHGCYLVLMMMAWRRPSNGIPDNDKEIARNLAIEPPRRHVTSTAIAVARSTRCSTGRWKAPRHGGAVMTTEITRLSATTALTAQTIDNLDAMLAPLNNDIMWDFSRAIGVGARYRPDEWREPFDEFRFKPLDECLAPVDKYINETYPRVMAIIEQVQEPPITKFIIMHGRALVVSKPASTMASEEYLPLLIEQIETTIPKFSTAAIIAGFRKMIRSPSEWLPSIGMVIDAIDRAEIEFQKKVETLMEFKRRRDRVPAILEAKKREREEHHQRAEGGPSS
jgi:hypothetical protein